MLAAVYRCRFANLVHALQIREQRGDDQKKERGQRRPFQGEKRRVGSDRAQNRQQQSRKQQCDGQPNPPLRLRDDTDRQDRRNEGQKGLD